MSVRQIDELTETIYRCRHHEFEGLSVRGTAERLGISIPTVVRKMNELRVQAPQLFPILTKFQKAVYDMAMSGHNVQEMQAYFEHDSDSSIQHALSVLRDNGLISRRTKCNMKTFNEVTMTQYVRETF